jgi:hypothetical protein
MQLADAETETSIRAKSYSKRLVDPASQHKNRLLMAGKPIRI